MADDDGEELIPILEVDVEGSGTLSSKEIHACLLDLDVRCSFADVWRMIKEADIDGNGEIDSDEFLEMMACNGASSGKKWGNSI